MTQKTKKETLKSYRSIRMKQGYLGHRGTQEGDYVYKESHLSQNSCPPPKPLRSPTLQHSGSLPSTRTSQSWDVTVLKKSSFPFCSPKYSISSVQSLPLPNLPLYGWSHRPLAQLNPWEPTPDLGTTSGYHTFSSPQHLAPLSSLPDPPNSLLYKENWERKKKKGCVPFQRHKNQGISHCKCPSQWAWGEFRIEKSRMKYSALDIRVLSKEMPL